MTCRSLIFVSVTVMLFAEASCRDPSQQAVVETTEQEAVEPHPQTVLPTEADLDPVASLICDIYEDWPRSLLEELPPDRSNEVMQARASGRLDALDALDGRALSDRVTLLCPDVVPAGSVADDGSIPRTESAPADLPGLYPPSEANTRSRERARFEWTAVGLGCLGLSEGEDRDLAELEAAFLSQMGYTLEGYISTSMEMDHPEMSERIFRRIVNCAHRFGAEPIE